MKNKTASMNWPSALTAALSFVPLAASAVTKTHRYFISAGLALALAVALTGGIGVTLTVAQQTRETPPDILAAQIRSQGYRCDRSLSAERDPAQSRPDEPVWVLICGNATYRIRLVPDMAANVERLE